MKNAILINCCKSFGNLVYLLKPPFQSQNFVLEVLCDRAEVYTLKWKAIVCLSLDADDLPVRYYSLKDLSFNIQICECILITWNIWIIEDSGLANKAYEATGSRCQACSDFYKTVDDQVNLCSHCIICALGTDHSRSNEWYS